MGKGLDTSPGDRGCREEKAQLGLQAQQLERMRNAGAVDTEHIPLRISTIGSIISRGTSAQQRRMGRIRLRSRVHKVTALLPCGEGRLAAEQPTANGAVLTWENFRLEDLRLSMAQARRLVEAQTESVRAISIHYLSPVKIKEHEQWVERSELGAVMRAVVRWLRILS